MCDVADAQTDEIAAAKLAVDGQVKHGEIANGMGILKVYANGPDVFGFEGWLLADKFSLIPGVAFVDGFHNRFLGC